MTKIISLAAMLIFVAGMCSAMAQNMSDPTRPTRYAVGADDSSSSNVKPDAIKVTAVFITSESRYAVINGQTLQQGEPFREFEVVEVLNDGVILQSAGIRKEILINNQSVKKDVSNDF